MAHFSSSAFAPMGVAGLDGSPMSDPAFEPDSHFAFDDGEHRYGNLGPDLPHMQSYGSHFTMNESHGEANGENRIHDSLEHPKVNSLGSESLSSRERWACEHDVDMMDPELMADDMPTTVKRSVSRHLGQLTPPDDTSLPTSMADDDEPAATTAFSQDPTTVQALPDAKSERARNAANQRHAKTKKSRQSSRVDMLSPLTDEPASSDERKEKYREKNRLAAAKCRAKKKTNVEDLEVRAREATARNSQLKLQARELRDAFSELRSHALMHDPSEGCRCTDIHLYNSNKAQEAARGAIALPPYLCVSTQGQEAFGLFDGPDRLGRAWSFSAPSHPPHVSRPTRSQSFAESNFFLQDLSSMDQIQRDSDGLSDFSLGEE